MERHFLKKNNKRGEITLLCMFIYYNSLLLCWMK